MTLISILTSLAGPLALVATIVYFVRRGDPPVRSSGESFTAGPVPPGWVRVPGEVMRLRAFGAGGWTIRYPMPDGSWAELTAAYTRPSALCEGMTVPVLVDPRNPTRARLDFAPHTSVIELNKTLWIGIVAVAGVFACVVVGVLVLVRAS